MGKETGFLELDRQDRTYADPAERLKHYREFVIPHSEDGLRKQASRCMNCGIPFCHSGCPLGNLIPEWNDLVRRGHWEEAAARLHSTNNFPEVTGRICPAPCEDSCVLGINQPAVTIKVYQGERDFARDNDVRVHLHTHETAQEIRDSLAQFGMRPLARLDRIGLVDDRLIAVHMTQLTDDEIAQVTRFDPWFLSRIREIVDAEHKLRH